MTLTQLIDELERIHRERGNIRVVVTDGDADYDVCLHVAESGDGRSAVVIDLTGADMLGDYTQDVTG